ncbi:MAG: NUDIX hydrolase [Chloroflexota bacterium]|nr:NUDIX hydrolase [Chloroflexota bacterium]MDE2930773.1 NUDIX hydrolase [Chloroflexota bacterium]
MSKETQDSSHPPLGWKLIESKVAYYGRFPVREDVLEAEADGRRMLYTYLDIRRDAVAVLALTDSGEAVLVRQYRHPLRRTTLEVPAGALDPGEDPEAGALRELEEETGYRAGQIRPLGAYHPSTPLLPTMMRLYFATNLDYHAPKPDAFEIIQVELVPVGDLLQAVLDGKHPEATLTASLLFAAQRGWLPT